MNIILGNRDIASRKLGSLQYFDVPAGAFPIPWNQGKECADPEKCSKNALQGGRFEGVSPEEYRRRQVTAARKGIGFTKQELIVPVGGDPGIQVGPWMNVPPGFWPGTSPSYLYPVNVATPQPAAAAAPSENGISTKTIVIGGAILVAGLLAVVLLK
jgi:hypothetical protein